MTVNKFHKRWLIAAGILLALVNSAQGYNAP